MERTLSLSVFSGRLLAEELYNTLQCTAEPILFRLHLLCVCVCGVCVGGGGVGVLKYIVG